MRATRSRQRENRSGGVHPAERRRPWPAANCEFVCGTRSLPARQRLGRTDETADSDATAALRAPTRVRVHVEGCSKTIAPQRLIRRTSRFARGSRRRWTMRSIGESSRGAGVLGPWRMGGDWPPSANIWARNGWSGALPCGAVRFVGTPSAASCCDFGEPVHNMPVRWLTAQRVGSAARRARNCRDDLHG